MGSLANFDPHQFLREYWQQKPLIIRQGLNPALFVLTPEELAGLACEDEVEARLIQTTGPSDYSVRHGPFDEAVFNRLSDQDWTLLVQAVDHIVPEVAALLDYFRFIPNWRIDDIMVSYAPAGGSAGPHYDNYDVFLIQGAGSRRWKVGPPVKDTPPLCDHPDLRLLAAPEFSDEWELNPGDILYLPPRFAHWGVSTASNCMTYSVGFRGPSTAELISEFSDQIIAQLDDCQRYEDRHLALQDNPGEISTAAIDKVQQLVIQQFSDRENIARWFGQYMTQPKYEPSHDVEHTPFDEHTLLSNLSDQDTVERDPASRFSYLVTAESVYLFVNGHEFQLSPEHLRFAEMLCASSTLTGEQITVFLQDHPLRDALLALFHRGNLYFEHELYD